MLATLHSSFLCLIVGQFLVLSSSVRMQAVFLGFVASSLPHFDQPGAFLVAAFLILLLMLYAQHQACS